MDRESDVAVHRDEHDDGGGIEPPNVVILWDRQNFRMEIGGKQVQEVVSWHLEQSVDSLVPVLTLTVLAPHSLLVELAEANVNIELPDYHEEWSCSNCGILNDPYDENLWRDDGACWRCEKIVNLSVSTHGAQAGLAKLKPKGVEDG